MSITLAVVFVNKTCDCHTWSVTLTLSYDMNMYDAIPYRWRLRCAHPDCRYRIHGEIGYGGYCCVKDRINHIIAWWRGSEMLRSASPPLRAQLRRIAWVRDVSFTGWKDHDSLDGVLFIFDGGSHVNLQTLEVESEELVFNSTSTKVASYTRGGNQVCLLDVASQRYDMLSFHAGVHALAFTTRGDEMVLAQVDSRLP